MLGPVGLDGTALAHLLADGAGEVGQRPREAGAAVAGPQQQRGEHLVGGGVGEGVGERPQGVLGPPAGLQAGGEFGDLGLQGGGGGTTAGDDRLVEADAEQQHVGDPLGPLGQRLQLLDPVGVGAGGVEEPREAEDAERDEQRGQRDAGEQPPERRTDQHQRELDPAQPDHPGRGRARRAVPEGVGPGDGRPAGRLVGGVAAAQADDERDQAAGDQQPAEDEEQDHRAPPIRRFSGAVQVP